MKSIAAILCGMLVAQAVWAADLFGTVEAVSGEATLTSESGSVARIVTETKIYVGQSVQTAADGEVHIVTADDGLVALRPNSSFRVGRYQAKGEATDIFSFSLLKGALRSVTGWIAKRNPAAYRLQAGAATIGVRGTDHETTLIETASDQDQPGTFDTVYEGVTFVQTQHGSVEVHVGEHAFAARGQALPPALLERTPAFMQHRSLKLEQRIHQRKTELGQALRERFSDKLENARSKADERKADAANRREKSGLRSENRRLPRNPK